MKAVIIDSTCSRLALAVLDGEKTYSFLSSGNARRHTSEILTELDVLLCKAGVKAREVEYIGVVVGPGSFTGIRIGVSTANAMATASGAKLVEITELEALLINEERALGLIDCRHGNYYALVKDGGLEYKPLTSEEVACYDLKKVELSDPDINLLKKTLLQKIEREEFSTVAQPYYMKKSSAEA